MRFGYLPRLVPLLFALPLLECKEGKSIDAGRVPAASAGSFEPTPLDRHCARFAEIWKSGGNSFREFEAGELSVENAQAVAAFVHCNVMTYGLALRSVTPKTSLGESGEGPDPATGEDLARFVKLRNAAYNRLNLKNRDEIDALMDEADRGLKKEAKRGDVEWKLLEDLTERYRALSEFPFLEVPD